MVKDKKKLLDKEISDAMKTKGKERVNDIKYIIRYVKEKEGENGFNDLVKELKKYNFELPDVDKLSSMEWTPRFVPRVFLIGAIIFFDWTQEEVFEMGKRATTSFRTIKLFIKWFSSVRNTLTIAIRGWNKYLTEGKASLIEFDKNKKQCVLEIRDYDIPSIITVYYEGIFTKVLEIATGNNKVEVKEFENKNNHTYHKFRAKW